MPKLKDVGYDPYDNNSKKPDTPVAHLPPFDTVNEGAEAVAMELKHVYLNRLEQVVWEIEVLKEEQGYLESRLKSFKSSIESI